MDTLLRLGMATIIGGFIGWERGVSRRPAGFRTHILVSLGACIAMLTGESVTHQTGAGDATRIASQVISGIGFLGAGTIMKVGASIRGLTTAASLWVTACLGLAAGAGQYVVVLSGLLIVFATLTLFESMEKRFIYGKMTTAVVTLATDNPSELIERINSMLLQNNINMQKIKVAYIDGRRSNLKFEMHSRVSNLDSDFAYVISKICAMPGIIDIQVEEY